MNTRRVFDFFFVFYPSYVRGDILTGRRRCVFKADYYRPTTDRIGGGVLAYTTIFYFAILIFFFSTSDSYV